MSGRVLTTLTDGLEARTLLAIALGDLGLIAALVLLGRLHHGYALIAQPIATLETMLPFFIGWFVVSVLAGAYTSTALESRRRLARVTTVAWLGAANVGLILRSSDVFVGSSLWPFNLIMTGLGVVALVAWRVGYLSFRHR